MSYEPTPADLAAMTPRRRWYYRHRTTEVAAAGRRRRAHLPRYAEAARTIYHADVETARARKRREYAANPEPRRAAASRIRRADPERNATYARARRARELDAFVEHVSTLVVLEISDGICGICGEPIELEDFEVDHILSLVGGGEHSYQNVQGSHGSCNRRKGEG